jgi:hypothetical protein
VNFYKLKHFSVSSMVFTAFLMFSPSGQSSNLKEEENDKRELQLATYTVRTMLDNSKNQLVEFGGRLSNVFNRNLEPIDLTSGMFEIQKEKSDCTKELGSLKRSAEMLKFHQKELLEKELKKPLDINEFPLLEVRKFNTVIFEIPHNAFEKYSFVQEDFDVPGWLSKKGVQYTFISDLNAKAISELIHKNSYKIFSSKHDCLCDDIGYLAYIAGSLYNTNASYKKEFKQYQIQCEQAYKLLQKNCISLEEDNQKYAKAYDNLKKVYLSYRESYQDALNLIKAYKVHIQNYDGAIISVQKIEENIENIAQKSNDTVVKFNAFKQDYEKQFIFAQSAIGAYGLVQKAIFQNHQNVVEILDQNEKESKQFLKNQLDSKLDENKEKEEQIRLLNEKVIQSKSELIETKLTMKEEVHQKDIEKFKDQLMNQGKLVDVRDEMQKEIFSLKNTLSQRESFDSQIVRLFARALNKLSKHTDQKNDQSMLFEKESEFKSFKNMSTQPASSKNFMKEFKNKSLKDVADDVQSFLDELE